MATPPITPTRASTAGQNPRTPKEREPANPVGTRPNPSSPLKSAPIRVHSRKDAQESTVALPAPDPEFVSKHLSELPPNFGGQFRDCVEAIQQVGSNSLKMAAPLAELLTRYSESAYKKATGVKKPNHHYVFLNTQHNAPTGTPYGELDREDILAVPGPARNYGQVENRSDYKGIPLYDAVSVIECKSEGEQGGAQLASYLFQLFEARPDMVGTYALWASPDEYQIIWSDASGVVASPLIKWEDHIPLKQFVWSLYVPPAQHVMFDESMVRQLGEDDIWTITVETEPPQVYENLTRKFIGSSWGRRTNVFASQEKGAGLFVIKDSFPDSERYSREVDALQAIHRDAVFPGVVRLLRSDDDSDASKIYTAPINESEGDTLRIDRRKARFVMGSTGEDLLQAKSVLDILKAVFDILEIHRALVELNILHRDISIYNILIYPKHNPTTMTKKKLVKNSPVFIRQVLKGKKNSLKIDKSSALLIDFDNCAEACVGEEGDNRPLKRRTGTPMFIARSVAQRMVLGLPTIQYYVQMPLLGEEARELYEASYGAETYQRFCDDGQTVHGVIPFPVSPPVPYPVINKKRDDESRGNADEDDSNREEDPGEDEGKEDSGEEDEGEEDSGEEDSGEEDSGEENEGEENEGEENEGEENEGEENEGEENEGEENEGEENEGEKDGKNQPNSVHAEEPSDFHHRPEHDVESIFWVLFYTLIQANPRHSKKEVDSASRSAYWQILSHFHNHHIFDNVVGDSRDIVLRAAPRQIESMLHPELRSLSGMLKAMIEQINPEYGHLPSKGLDKSHLHEAMRRILLEQIVQMKKEPILLQPGNSRPGPPPKTKPQAQSQNGSKAKKSSHKRTREAEAAAGGTANKRVKSHSGTSTFRRQDMPTSLPGKPSYGRC